MWARSTSSVNWPSPCRRRSSSFRGTSVPNRRVAGGAENSSTRSRTSDIRLALRLAVQIELDGVDDELVARAAAEHAGELLADVLARQLPTVAGQCGRGHEERGRAESALQPVLVLEHLLQR